jgi:hypothetical protein
LAREGIHNFDGQSHNGSVLKKGCVLRKSSFQAVKRAKKKKKKKKKEKGQKNKRNWLFFIR